MAIFSKIITTRIINTCIHIIRSYFLVATVISCTSLFSYCQSLHNPYSFYDNPGGMYDIDSVRSVYIDFYDNSYDSILDSNWVLNTGLRLPAKVTFSDGTFLDSVGVRYKGNSTYAIARNLNNPKVPYNLDINYFIPGQRILGYKKLKLANALLDPTFVKELSGYAIYQRYLPSPEANFIKVFVEGKYLGLYINTESVDSKFLKKHFGENDGVLFKCDPVQQFGQGGPVGQSTLEWLGSDSTLYYDHYTLKSDYGWGILKDFIDVLNNSPELLDSVLNIDRVLWAFAVNSVIDNLDTYNGIYQHNYYLYRTHDGLFQMIPWDVSESFVGALLGSNPNSNELYEYDPFNGYNCWWYPLIQELISDPGSKYGKIYSAHLRTIINESLDATAIKDYADYLQAKALPSVLTDTNKVFGIPAYYSNVNNEYIIPGIFSTAGIISTVNLRKPFLLSHPDLNKLAPTITNVSLSTTESGTYIIAEVYDADSVELMTTISSYNSKFVSTWMHDDGLNGDLVAGDNLYSAYLPQQNTGFEVKYYVRATNAEAVMLNPERAEYIFYRYSPQEQNNNTLFQEVLLYPNPTTIVITIQSNNSEDIDCSIYNLWGELLLSDYSTEPVMNIDVSHFAQGVYLFQINGKAYRVMKR